MEVRKPRRVTRRGERGGFSKGRHHEGSPWSAAVQSTYIFCGLQCTSGMHPWPCHPRLRQMLTRLPTNPTPGPCRCHAPARAFFGVLNCREETPDRDSWRFRGPGTGREYCPGDRLVERERLP